LAQPEGAWQPFDPDGIAGNAYRKLAKLLGPPEQGLRKGVAVPG
jgi:hypothetical protein